jgi:two-component system chemotaxis response regulator CheY
VGRPKTILVVDDDARIRRFVARLLRQAGYRVRTTADPSRARTLAVRLRPALVILDIAMPGLDGLEVAGRLRADRRTRPIPRMFLTAQPPTDHIEEARSVQAQAYLRKPFRPEALLELVGQIVTPSNGEIT